MKNLSAFVSDDRLCYTDLATLGWEVTEIPWESPPPDWRAFDKVIIRSPWNYQDHPEAFLKLLESVEDAGVSLQNSLELVRWNLRKTYLRDLSGQGVPIVPTEWREQGNLEGLEKVFDQFDCGEIILKPVVGANSDHTFRLTRVNLSEKFAQLQESFGQRDFMVQPFLKDILSEGEFSLFFFNNVYSHAIAKIPRQGDFRVQEEFGGLICAVNPAKDLLDTATQIISSLKEKPLYGRVDLINDGSGQYRLMELELIEPSLYLRMHPEAGGNFARAIASP